MHKSSFLIQRGRCPCLAGATAMPAHAMVHEIGSVNISSGHYTNVQLAAAF